MCHFFANYVTGGTHTGYMTYLSPLLSNRQNSVLDSAVRAVALAALSNIRLSPKTKLRSQADYLTALCGVNQGLKDPAICKRDDTLAAVVLLGLYEVLISPQLPTTSLADCPAV